MKELRAHPEGVDLGPLGPDASRRPCTRKGKRLDLAPGLVLDDVRRLDDVAAPADGELLLIGRRHKQDCNSWMHNSERLTRGKPRHQLLMHPDDLADRGLTAGSTVSVRSRVGTVEVEVAATDDMMRGVVSLPHGYGHARPGSRMQHAATGPGCRSTTSPTPSSST